MRALSDLHQPHHDPPTSHLAILLHDDRYSNAPIPSRQSGAVAQVESCADPSSLTTVQPAPLVLRVRGAKLNLRDINKRVSYSKQFFIGKLYGIDWTFFIRG